MGYMRLHSSFIICLGLAVSACSSGKAPNTPWLVGIRTFGPVRYGMTLSQLQAVLGRPIPVDSSGSLEGCWYLTPPGAPPGSSLMVIDTVIVRVDIDTSGIKTTEGAQIGLSEAEIKALFPGQIRVEPHPYDGPDRHYLIYQPAAPADTGFGMIFETDGKVVRSYRAGPHPHVDAIEGCA